MNKLSRAAHVRLNDPERIARRNRWFEGMKNVFDSRPDAYNREYVYTLLGSVPRPANDMLAYTEPEKWVYQCLEIMAQQPECTANRFAPECVEYPIYGVHFIDKIFGADVFFKDDQWNVRYLKTPVGQLKMPNLDEDETWSLAKRAAMAFLEADVRLPLFGLPTLSSALNIILNLYGQDCLITMLEDEEAALHDLRIINGVIRELHRWYLKTLPSDQLQPVISWCRTQPPGFGQICGCSCQLLSGPLYRELIAPLDDAVLAEYPHGGMIHLCGSHTQHIKTFSEMEHLRAIQVNDRACADLKLYFDGLREDQVIYFNPCKEMSIEEAIRITGGKRLIVVENIDAPRKPQ